MKKYILFFGLFFIISCSSKKEVFVEKDMTKIYDIEESNYHLFTFYAFNDDKNLISMSGVGKRDDIKNFENQNIKAFVESFFSNFHYTPNLDLEGNYNDVSRCLYDQNVTWLGKKIYEPSKKFEFLLEDKSYIIQIEVSELLPDLNIDLIDSENSCLRKNSVEYPISEIKNIKKVFIIR